MMSKKIDMNADMGESFGAWKMGNDDALFDVVTSANVACGFHGGDPDIMFQTMLAAVERGVGIGAHPGLPDLQGFGRRRMTIAPDSLANMVRYQLGAAIVMAEAAGGRVTHFKLHGALSNMASDNDDISRVCFSAAKDVLPDIVILVLASTSMQTVADKLGCIWAGEVYADRAYDDTAKLFDRRAPGAVIHDPALATKRVREMVAEGAIIAESGKRIPTQIDTICVHGDTPTAFDIACGVRGGLREDGVVLSGLDGSRRDRAIENKYDKWLF